MANDINVQDMFLEKVKNEKSLVAIYFEKIKMLGIVKDFDQFSITLDSNGQEQMVYKQGINYISLQKAKRPFRPRPGGGGFRPRDNREGDGEEGQTSDGQKRPYSPRPRYSSDNQGSDNRGGFRRPDDRNFGSNNERRFDSNNERRFDSKNSSSYSSNRDNRDSSQRNSSESSDEQKKVFRVQKPFPPKKS